ncbi:hypothetical protein [Flammeovirga aprica]|uniref:Lipoprotein n=1 Tax=Flammeovirga aprica JL-4 TaxID=694437 RepID=A0A7X9RZD6_9BACT|nr:hypothetical protein [Flammeovirga aprica]NME71553.1 hypothetical protein [Flammeovirga aprica JL-4]
MKFLINISLSILFIIFSVSCDQQPQNQKKEKQSLNQQSQNQKKESQNSLQQLQISAEQIELVKDLYWGTPVTEYPYYYEITKNYGYESWKHNGFYPKTVHAFIDTTMLYENRRLFKAIDSLNLINEENNKYEALGTIYDKLYWYEEDGQYIASGNRYSQNKFFSGWERFNIITYIKVFNQVDKQEYSPFYLSSHNKYTGDMIDRLSFEFKGTYNAIRDGRGAFIIYKDSIIHKIDENTRKYLITEEGKFVKI